MSTTVTLTRPAPAAAPASAKSPADLGYLAVVSVTGGLRLPAAASDATATALRRRTQTGTTYRVDLGGGITCWLDGDQQDGTGELNWVATAMCTALSGGTFAGPDDAPFVCGQALFTGTAGDRPIALSERQLRRVVDAHAAASADEPGEPGHVHAWADAAADLVRSPFALA